MSGSERPDSVNGCPVEWEENRFGVMKAHVEVEVGETQTLTVRRHIRNPLTDRRHDLTKLSDDGYLKPFLALLAATNTPDHINIGSAPVLTFDKDRFEYRAVGGQHVLVKREAESVFGEQILETADNDGTESEQGRDADA